MIVSRVKSIDDVVRRHLCTGCGACAGLSPDIFRMEDRPGTGRRPVRIASRSGTAADRGPLSVCPGAGAGQRPVPVAAAPRAADQPCAKEWGSVLEIWEGHAADPEMRWRGSSGGVVTALAAFALESGGAEGVVHVRQRAGDALTNDAVISRTRDDLVLAAGSRYAPASPCERLGDVAASAGPMVFVGKPCDVQAASAAARQHQGIAGNLALTIAIFCAGTPSSNGTRALASALGVPDGATVTAVRYRGEGWPGVMSASYVSATGEEKTSRSLSYEEGWGGILQKHRQWRCHLCADHTGEFADISVGDPWDKPRGSGEAQGSSLIVVRSEKGRAALRKAIAAGMIIADPRPLGALAAAQPNLARTRRILFGRLLGLRIMGLGAPRYAGWSLGSLWLRRTGWRDKLGSVAGTVKRAYGRRLWQAEASGKGEA